MQVSYTNIEQKDEKVLVLTIVITSTFVVQATLLPIVPMGGWSQRPFLRRLLFTDAPTNPAPGHIGISLYEESAKFIKGFPTRFGAGGLVQRKAHWDGALIHGEVVG